MKLRHLALSVVVLGVTGLASLAGQRGESPPVTVIVKEPAIVTRDGELRLTLRARCEPVGEVLEAFAMVQQDEVSGIVGFSPVCDGRTRTYRLVVEPLEGEFEPGEAHVSAFVLLCDDAGTCEQGQDSRLVDVRGAR